MTHFLRICVTLDRVGTPQEILFLEKGGIMFGSARQFSGSLIADVPSFKPPRNQPTKLISNIEKQAELTFSFH
jgi:hypothetical protein